MDIIRRLPVSPSAPELARPAVDLAVGSAVPGGVVEDLRTLAGDLVGEAAAVSTSEVLELRVSAAAPVVRLEVGWNSRVQPPEPPGRWALRRTGGSIARINRLSDRWGLWHMGDRECLWAEKHVHELTA